MYPVFLWDFSCSYFYFFKKKEKEKKKLASKKHYTPKLTRPNSHHLIGLSTVILKPSSFWWVLHFNYQIYFYALIKY